MNFVKIKLELARIESKQRLEIWLDEGGSIENVPASVKDEGHRIITQRKVEQYWRVVIEKK